MLKILLALIVIIALAVGGKSYYRTKQANEVAARLAQQETVKKAEEAQKEKEKQAEQARVRQLEKTEEEATLAVAKREIERSLKDPSSVQYRNLRVVNSAVCGEANAKNSFGAYVGFRRFVYSYDELNFEPDGQASQKLHEIFEHMVFLGCTPLEQLEVICKANPERCNAVPLR
jgi:Tfp pilus assembly major pilin PilA